MVEHHFVAIKQRYEVGVDLHAPPVQIFIDGVDTGGAFQLSDGLLTVWRPGGREAPLRYQLNNIDRLVATDLKFSYPEDAFDLQRWCVQALEDFGRGPNKVVIRVTPDNREEMLRLGLKPDSEVHHQPGGTLRIVLYVDRWRWLVPLVASFGGGVVIDEPRELREAVRQHHASALAAYQDEPVHPFGTDAEDYRNDDSRLRATRGRTPRKIREQGRRPRWNQRFAINGLKMLGGSVLKPADRRK